ncbi:DUF1275 family protein [Janibacter sp. GS2]|uniref:DUF1275 family protein n=1 Tax=Janibacter sp. GS2 TaxID=3442646 RepID=UPI003EBC9F5F
MTRARDLRLPTEAPPEDDPRQRAEGLRNALVVVLAVTSGAADALGFLALGSAFTSVMTGNMVLFGVATAQGDVNGMLLTSVAIGAFVVGAALGTRIAGTPVSGDPVWPAAVSRALGVELVLFTGVGIAWWAFGSELPTGAYLPLLAASAAALGLQSSAIQRFGVSGLSTTYLTGTLTTVVIRLTSGHGFRAVRHSAVILLGLIVGAASMAALISLAPALVPVLLIVTVAGVLAVVLLRREELHR